MRVLALVLLVLTLNACSGPQARPTGSAVAAPSPTPDAQSQGFKATDLKIGSGPEAVPGKAVSVHYTGWLESNHKQFDSSYGRNRPFEFRLGAGQVIPGWDRGVAGMKVGGKRNLVIPAALGYGHAGAGGGLIPPDATLVFDVELLEVK